MDPVDLLSAAIPLVPDLIRLCLSYLLMWPELEEVEIASWKNSTGSLYFENGQVLGTRGKILHSGWTYINNDRVGCVRKSSRDPSGYDVHIDETFGVVKFGKSPADSKETIHFTSEIRQVWIDRKGSFVFATFSETLMVYDLCLRKEYRFPELVWGWNAWILVQDRYIITKGVKSNQLSVYEWNCDAKTVDFVTTVSLQSPFREILSDGRKWIYVVSDRGKKIEALRLRFFL